MKNSKHQELFFATVGSLGSYLQNIENYLKFILSYYGFSCFDVKISNEMRKNFGKLSLKEEDRYEKYDEYVKSYQDAGDICRILSEDGGVLALLAVNKIRDIRKKNKIKKIKKSAYIIHSLKHVEEEKLLRKIYGGSFFLIGSYNDEEDRRNRVANIIRYKETRYKKKEILSEEKKEHKLFFNRSKQIIDRDYQRYNVYYKNENDLYREFSSDIKNTIKCKKKFITNIFSNIKKFGQNVNDTFPLADLFIYGKRYSNFSFSGESCDNNLRLYLEHVHNTGKEHEYKTGIHRFIKIILNYPFHTPHKNEYSMAHAWLASLRSSDLSRQVGAAIVDQNSNIVGLGTNEVPGLGGGLYWDEQNKTNYELPDFQHFPNKHGNDIKHHIRNMIESELDQKIAEKVMGSNLTKIGEFHRTIHAEMAAIIDALMNGKNIKNCTLYTTTFPCHNCAKHMIACGIKKVVFIFPYSKSKAFDLFPDQISGSVELDPEEELNINPYEGINPKRYNDFFSLEYLKRKDKDCVAKWNDYSPRTPFTFITQDIEEKEVKKLKGLKKKINDGLE